MSDRLSNSLESGINFKHNQTRLFNSLLENVQGVVYSKLYDQQLTVLYISDYVTQLTGYTPDALIYNKQVSFQALKHTDDRDRIKAVIDQAVAEHTSFRVEYRITHADGRVIWVREVGNAVYDSDGQPLGLEGYIEDISELVEAKNAVNHSDSRYKSIFENALHGIFQTTLAGEYKIVNQTLAEIYGYGSTEELVSALNDINKQLYVSPTRREEFIQAMNVDGMVINFESQVYKKDGDIAWISENARKVFDGAGEFLYYEGTVIDITKLKITEAALKYSEHLEKQAHEELYYQKYALDKHAIVSMMDTQGNLTYVNDQYCALFGFSKEEVIGKHYRLIDSGYHSEAFFEEMYLQIASGNSWSGEICNKSKDGCEYWLQMTVVPYMADNGKPTKFISIRTDITERKKAEDKSKFLALYDPLTALPNKNLLNDRIMQALAASKRSNNHCALLYLDIDHFKKLNDTLGHELGDLMLKDMSQRISHSLREVDTVARAGGDKFAILLENLSDAEEMAVSQAQAISNKLIAAVNRPYLLSDHELYTTVSVGVMVFDHKQSSYKTIVQQAEIAMYEVKASGRNAMCFFQPTMRDQVIQKVELERELRKAVEQNQLALHYQVQVNSVRLPTGAEALIRWHHPERGMISPFHFIPLAEETGLILSIGQWVLETACKQLKAWEKSDKLRHLTLSINVSAKQFYQADFVEQVKFAIKDNDINPRKLKLELTESMLLENIELTIKKMHQLLKLGVSFSLDDFGTGYSSLQYLKRLPIYQLKIDQSFVRELSSDSSDQAIVCAIIAMAKILNISLIAEGVETEAQKEYLYKNGCADYQGYLFGKPIPIDEFEYAICA